jgi:hypothetical protein
MEDLQRIDSVINDVARSLTVIQSEDFRRVLLDYMQQLYQQRNALIQQQQPTEPTMVVQETPTETQEPPKTETEELPEPPFNKEEEKVPQVQIMLNPMYLRRAFRNTTTIKEYFDKITEFIIKHLPKRSDAMDMIRDKCYVQLITTNRFTHEKDYKPVPDVADKESYTEKPVRRENLVQSFNEFKSVLKRLMGDIVSDVQNFEMSGSNWTFTEPLSFSVRLIKFYDPLTKSGEYIKTPEWLKKRKAIINIKNNDNNCFYKCIYRFFNLDKKNRNNNRDIHMDVVNQWFVDNHIDTSMFNKGITVDTLRIFEETNKIAINIFGLGKNGHEETTSIYLSIYINQEHNPMINLGVLEDDDKSHYVLITKLNCVLSRKYDSDKRVVCYRCLTSFSKLSALANHIHKYHSNHVLPIIKLPKPEKAYIRFSLDNQKDFKKTIWYPRVCYADFEAFNIFDDSAYWTVRYKQVPFSYCIISPELLDLADEMKLSKKDYRRGCHCGNPKDLLQHFWWDLKHLHELHFESIQRYLEVPKLTEEEQQLHDSAKCCMKCGHKFDHDCPKVRHHDHSTGKYIGPWCKWCNLFEGVQHFKTIVYFHNFKGYDCHHIIKYCIEYLSYEDTTFKKHRVISKSKQKIIHLDVGKYVFMDSMNHLSGSLDTLVETLRKSGHKFEICDKYGLPECLRSKGIYPYRWVDSLDKLYETSLPSIEWFDNDITGEKCTPERYQRAKKIWEETKCETFKDYHERYQLADVLLLAEVMTKYRKDCMKLFGLDPARFVSVQSMTLTNWLKHLNGQAVEVLSDNEMYDFFRKAIRGGMCSVGELTYANVYNKPGEHIIGFDMNALYPTAMLFPVPAGDYAWIDPSVGYDLLQNYDINSSEHGFYFECDIEVPTEIHDKVSAYPLFPEMIDGKLKATLYNKTNYIVHIIYLQLGLRLGYKVTKIHRILSFRQAPIMRDYIMMLAMERKKYPKGTTMNELYKLMANSLFGKTCENPMNYRKVKFSSGRDQVLRMLNNSRMKNYIILDERAPTMLFEMEVDEVMYNKPLPIGVTILDISKWYMQTFYYEVLQPFYGDRMKMMYTDTDSLVLKIDTEDVKKDIKQMQEWFESDETKGLPGVMKIEKDNILEFRAYSPKHYYFIQNFGGELKVSLTFKGIPSYARGKKMSQEEIKQHLEKSVPIPSNKEYTMMTIRSTKEYDMELIKIVKVINDNDDKRYYIDKYHTLALGHYATAVDNT